MLARMEEMQKSLDRLNQKIDRYEQGLMQRKKAALTVLFPEEGISVFSQPL